MIQLINKKENIFGDNIAFVENWDFSKANLNEENRILAITQVASICYQNPNALGSESLYNRLAAESKGLPSSSFEFVPVLLDPTNEKHKEILALEYSNVKKFGELICDGKYLLTNYRALVYDFENNENAYSFDIRTIYNTEIECEIIKQYFKVFLYKVDFPTRSQMVRHRVNWQELSRRYVSGKRVPFEFYISEKLQNNPKVEALIKQSEELYFELLENGVKPQEARRIIPQAGYSQIWGAFQPTQLANYFRLRDDSHAQWEIRQTALAMKELLEK
ncbi:FAD-dependent thymidylate synthase [Aliarcobacter butzleri]|uniref:Thymidylate synthase ThyX n=6 Tax=Arcobacteraceae TaxID=2808963 RepID=A8EX65_ALIB4|nr:FAD-dependent thymidylate synthase [Aliarcobacter butzleri]ABV68538.1 thymidylate synthase ThyX [Aliarcobacter butzleri RM4018]MCG3665003.1 FAD-dependent thymidylate synthase [Aliarcobacter butzleri]MCG3674587.1 FAD-dependent thymidylate synthase [Aliarcobacter butzleri]MCG3678599.1 FAD-dependent thymidylate synthase [Aliarcobacter butzleri]MCG3701169.1 FAD-dependent thymidylate synthase [Aliarcobacter butzleri]